jgi:hypothetical protein
MQAYRNIRPAYAGKLSSIELVLVWICYVAEVHYSRVVVVLARKDDRVEIIGVNISNGMLVCVPSSEAQIKSTHKSDFTIYETKLLVMRPVKDHVVGHAIHTLQSVTAHLGQICCVKR